MKLNKLIFGTLSFSMTSMALAGTATPLGAPLGITLGNALGATLGLLGTALPIAGAGLLTVAAVSLVLGIRIVRRKRNC